MSPVRFLRVIPDPRDPTREGMEADLLDAIGQAVIATDVQGQIIFWNAAAERLYGWTRDEVLGRNILEVTPSETSRARAAEIMDRLSRGDSWSGTFETRRKNGDLLTVEVTDTPVRDELGELKAIVGVSRMAVRLPPVDLPPESPPLLGLVTTVRNWVLAQGRNASWRGYLGAAVLFAVAFGASWLIRWFLGPTIPFIAYVPALAIGAAICGVWPTTALLVASAVVGSFDVPTPPGKGIGFDAAAAALFCAAGAILAGIVEFSMNVQHRLQEHERELALVNRELTHRLKNVFAITDAICRHTVMSKLAPTDMASAISGRIAAISAAQELLGANHKGDIELGRLVETVVRPMLPEPARLKMSGKSVRIPGELTTSFALVLHELATNALKYGAWAGDIGQVEVAWALDANGELQFEWLERGVMLTRAEGSGFGSTLIRRALRDAKVEHAIDPAGVSCRIRVPLASGK